MDSSATQEQIDRILRSQAFASKSQLRKLLQLLHQNMDSQIAITPDLVIRELWPTEIRTKRPADVATEVNRLRRALKTYYESDGANDPIAISLPNRSSRSGNGTDDRVWIVAQPLPEKVAPLESDRRLDSPVNSLRNQKLVVWIVAVGIVLGTVGYIIFRGLSFPDQPKFGRLEGSTLLIFDGDGIELWRKAFPDGIGPSYYYAQGLADRIWFGDLDGRGHTSVLFVYSPARAASQSSTLICYSDRGKEKWRWTPGKALPELAGSAAIYKTFALGVLKATDKRPPRIVVSSAHDTWWPNQLAILDSNGNVLSQYWHSGRLDHILLADVEGDGEQKIIATGVANGYDHQATLVELDPDKLFGASAEKRPEFQIHGMGIGQERLRLLFPRSDLNQALYQFNLATDPTFEHGSLSLTVLECTSPPGCRIWYEFDKDTRLVAAFAGSDEFRSAHERFYQSGKNAHILSAEERAAFQKIRCLVGCKAEYVPVGKLIP